MNFPAFNKQNLTGCLIALASTAFGATFWIIRNSLAETLSPEVINFYWFFNATIMLGIVFLFFGNKSELKNLGQVKWHLILLGFFNMLASLISIYAIKFLGGPVSSVTTQFSIVISFVLALFLLREKPKLIQVLGAVFVIAGITVINFDPEIFLSIGLFAGLVAGLFYSLSYIVAKKASFNVSPITINFARTAIMTVFAFIVMLVFSKPVIPNFNELLWLIVAPLMSAVIGTTLFYKGLKMIKVGYANAIKANETTFAIFYSFIFFIGLPSQIALIGCAITIIGVIIIALERN